MKFSHKLVFGLFFINLIILTNILADRIVNLLQKQSRYNPGEIAEINEMTEKDKRVEIDLSENDPLEYMKRKEELINLYLHGKNKNESGKRLRFRQTTSTTNNNNNPDLSTKPYSVSRMGDPSNKEYKNEEVVVQINGVKANSFMDSSTTENFFAENILTDEGKFWCSEGNHEFNTPVKFFVEFEKSVRLSAFWIHWAFAPGQYKISFANKKESDGSMKWADLIDWKQSVKDGDIVWWKNVIVNPKTRWKYKSFDERVNLDEPTWAKYLMLELRLPVNQYYGIYKLEFYIKSKAVVMLKSKKPGQESCMIVVNGKIANNSPVVMIDCLQAISYGDNRDLFVLHSNGFITTYTDNKCLQSTSPEHVDVLECAKSSDFKDDREKWILEYDGKIRSMKEEFTCLSVTDFSVKDDISNDDMKVTASSIQDDGIHGPEKVMGDDINTYWASNPTINEVIFEIYFYKYPYIIKDMEIEWKFPAKSFKAIGLFPDGYWMVFSKHNNNRETITHVNFTNKDLMGIRITMTESSSKIEDKYVYGIKNISLRTGGRYLRRDPCKSILLDANKFEIVDVTILDQVTGLENAKTKAELHRTRTKLRLIENSYKKVPDTLNSLKSTSASLSDKLHNISEKFIEMQLRLSKFSDFLNSEQIRIFTIATSEHFPANDCAHIIKAFPSKRSGMYWIKNECMPKAQNVYCDFDFYDKKGGLDYFIFNDNQPVNTPFKRKFRSHLDIKYKCYELGMEPLEIKNVKMLKNVFNLLKIFNFNLEIDYIIPIGYDYACDISKCSKIFKSINDENSGDISDMINSIYEESGNNINNLFSSLTSMDRSNQNLAAYGKNGNMVYEKLTTSKVSAIVCSTNQDGSKMKKNYIDVDCETNLRSGLFAANEVFSILRLNCPAGCATNKSAQIFGTDMYTDNSSVCRAAVHSGAKKDSEEALVEVSFQPGRNKYLGVDRYNVASLDYSEIWNRSFKVNKYQPLCPIDKLKEFKAAEEDEFSMEKSFIEIEISEKNIDKNKVLQKISQSDLEKYFHNFLINKNYNNNQSEVTSRDTNDENKKLVPILDEKIKEAELIESIEKGIENYEFLIDQDRSINSDKKKRKLFEQLAKISRFLQEDIGNKMNNNNKGLVLNTSENKINDLGKNEKSNSITGPGMLEKMRMMDSSNISKTSDQSNLSNISNLSSSNIFDNSNNINISALESTLKLAQDKLLQQQEDDKIKKVLGFQLPVQHSTTEIALTYISSIFINEKKQLSDLKKVSDDFKGIIGKTTFEVEKLKNDKDLGVYSQQGRFTDFESKTAIVLKFIFEIDRKIQNKLKQTEFKVKDTRENLDIYNIRESFLEDYNSQSISDYWDFYSSKRGKGIPPEWSYFQYFINGHYKVIQQKGGFMDNRTGAHLILKNKDYYDFEFKCSFLLKDKNTFGIVFRYLDPYNYYIFEVSNLEGGVKRIRKYLRGVPQVIEFKNDGGFIQDTWYNVKIRAQQSLFYIYMTDYNGPDLESHYELQFKYVDNNLVHGTVAFASFGMSYLLLDNISIVAIECTNFDDSGNGKTLALTPTCARFRETFRNGFNNRWKFIDPLESNDGPSKWVTVNDFAEREIVLTQQSLIVGSSEFQEGTIFLLDDSSKVCNNGRFIVKMKALDEGIVGLIFRYDNDSNGANSKLNNVNMSNSNYYTLEISGMPGNKFIRIRKKIKDKFMLISSNPLLGYTKDNWFKIILTIENYKFNAFVTENSSQDNIVKVFENGAVDNDLKIGLMGVSTYKTKVIFDEILLSPFDNLDLPEDEEDLLYVDEEELECIIF